MKDEIILMGHGGGGMLTRKLIDEVIIRELTNPILESMDDGACVTIPEADLVLTTDSYVVDPLFFPGGDIGKLAVCGTVNDLVMQGAEPRYLTLGLIIEEGFLVKDLARIMASIRETAESVGVVVVAGDTKVIEGRAERSGLFINTTGLGVRLADVDVSVSNAEVGDAVLVTGTMGDHGMTIMNARESLGMESNLESDVAPLWDMIKPLLGKVPGVRCLRDPTRGGVAAAVCDIARASQCGIRLHESALPIRDTARGYCGMLGMDPLNVANEGKAVIVCRDEDKSRVLGIVSGHPLGQDVSVIGRVCEDPVGVVLLETLVGGERVVDIPAGEDLPRIC